MRRLVHRARWQGEQAGAGQRGGGNRAAQVLQSTFPSRQAATARQGWAIMRTKDTRGHFQTQDIEVKQKDSAGQVSQAAFLQQQILCPRRHPMRNPGQETCFASLCSSPWEPRAPPFVSNVSSYPLLPPACGGV